MVLGSSLAKEKSRTSQREEAAVSQLQGRKLGVKPTFCCFVLFFNRTSSLGECNYL